MRKHPHPNPPPQAGEGAHLLPVATQAFIKIYIEHCSFSSYSPRSRCVVQRGVRSGRDLGLADISLIWDRLPIALVCAGLLAGVRGDIQGGSKTEST